MLFSLTKGSLYAAAPNISISLRGLSALLSLGFPSWSKEISDVELIIGVLMPMTGS